MEFKSEEARLVFDLFETRLRPIVSDFYKNKGKQHLTLVKAIESRYIALQESLESAKHISEKVELQRSFKKSLLKLLVKHSKALNTNSYTDFYDQYAKAIDKALIELPKSILVKEPFNGYALKITENPILTARKVLINTNRSTTLLFKRTTNFFRRILRKIPIDVVNYQKRNLKFRNITRQFILNNYIESIHHLFGQLMRSHSSGLIELWKLDEMLDLDFQKNLLLKSQEHTNMPADKQHLIEIFKKVKVEHQASLKEIIKNSETIGLEVFSQIDNALQIVDTLDLPNKTFRKNRIEKQKKKLETLYQHEMLSWENTHTALFDDWAVDVEITLLYYSVYDEFNFLIDKINSYVNTNIYDSFLKIRAYFAKSQQELEASATSKKALKEKIIDERGRITNDLIDKLLSQVTEYLTGCFTDDFETLLKDTNTLVEKVSNNRGFIRDKYYLKGAATSEVKYISPRELLYFEALPVFRMKVEEIGQWTDAQLEKARINLMGLGTVCNFTLESAQIMLEQNSGTQKKAINTAVDGFERALNHLNKAEQIIANIQSTIASELSTAINNFDNDILKLKNTDNIFDLNLKIARIKAVERTKKYKKQAIVFIRTAIPQVKVLFKNKRDLIFSRINEIKSRIGISEEKVYVSFELSEFIDNTKHTLKKLPFVYQRLFQINPTDEERFFVDREKELEALRNSYENWKKDRFITVAIVGEKGSGITSLISIFLNQSDIKIPVIKHTLSCKVYTNDAYFSLFSDLLGVEKFESNTQIIDYLNKVSGTQVVILENLQHMFIKLVNGFDCMNMFFELMAHTMKKVLWIGAYTTHSWNYLERTIHISNYFTNEIYLNPMSQENIEEIIFKRNYLSGFQINFQPDTYALNNKTYQKYEEQEKQDFLKRQFFSTLRHMSSGNISLALLYWLRSTQMAKNDSINIVTINKIDFSFVKNLTSNELFTMQTLILHDGLELEDFARVMNKPVSASRNLLTPLLEKGLLIKPRLKYNINPIIFRPMVNYLASRNFIN